MWPKNHSDLQSDIMIFFAPSHSHGSWSSASFSYGPSMPSLQFVSEHNLHTKCQSLNVNTSCDESSPISKAQVVDGLYYHEMAWPCSNLSTFCYECLRFCCTSYLVLSLPFWEEFFLPICCNNMLPFLDPIVDLLVFQSPAQFCIYKAFQFDFNMSPKSIVP